MISNVFPLLPQFIFLCSETLYEVQLIRFRILQLFFYVETLYPDCDYYSDVIILHN